MTDEEDVPTPATRRVPGAADDAADRARPTGPRPPRPLTPSRPWQSSGAGQDDAEHAGSDRIGVRSRPAPPSPRPIGSAGPSPQAPKAVPAESPFTSRDDDQGRLAPDRPWRRAPAPSSGGPAAEPPVTPAVESSATPPPTDARASAGATDRETSPAGLAPIRPWNADRPARLPERRMPRPSNPDVVLQDLAAEVAPERRVETDDERRRRFARQHAAADAARLAAPAPRLIDSGPLPPSYEPDPAVYDVSTDDDGEPRRRRFGRRRRDDNVPAEPLETVAPEPAPFSSAPFLAAPLQTPLPEAPPFTAPSEPTPVDPPSAPVERAVPASYEPVPTVDEPSAPTAPTAVDEAELSTPAVKDVIPVAPRHASPAPEARSGRWRRGRAQESAPAEPDVPTAEAPTVVEPAVVEPAAVEPAAVESQPTASGPGTKVTRWLLERAPDATAEPTSQAVDVTDAPALDLELADEFHGEPEAPTAAAPEPVAEPAPDSPAALPVASTRVRRGWRRRDVATVKDDDEGPFFPPEPADPSATVAGGATSDVAPANKPSEPPALVLPSVASVLDDVPLPTASEVPAVPVSRNRPRPRPRPTAAAQAPMPPSSDTPPPTPEQVSPARQRPRPRPAAARAAASPAADTSTEPDPAGLPASLPSVQNSADHPEAAAAPDDASGRRSPDISRFLDATESQPGDDEREPKEPMRRRRRIRGRRGFRVATKLLIVLVVAGVAAVVLRTYVVAPYYIPSASMEPALQGGGGTNDRILVDKITYRIHDPHQGDIVVFDRPDTWQVPDKTLVKRIVGLPGDRVSLRSGLVYVNGTRLTENYINKACGAAATKPLTGTSQWTVPMGDYFVMGDNRCDSEDSRAFGPIPGSKIVGRAFLIIWPVKRFGSP